MSDEREPYSLDYAATWLKVSPSWLAKQARENRVPHVLLGRHRLFMQADLDRIVAINRAELSSGMTPGAAARARKRAQR